LVIVKVKWFKCIKNYSKFIEDVFAVIACWLLFGETPTKAAAANIYFKLIYIK